MWINVLRSNTWKSPSIRGHWCIPKKLSMAREPATNDCKSQGTQNDSRFQSRNKWSEFDGMKSTGSRELRHTPSSNTRCSAKLYNVEGLNHKVHEPVTVLGMADMQSQDNWGMDDSGFNFLRTRARTAYGDLHKGSIDSICKIGTSLRHRRNQQRLHGD